MQFQKKQWVLRNEMPQDGEARAELLAQETGLSPLLTKLLLLRGYKTVEQIRTFFEQSDTSFYDPFLLSGMDLAVERILRAIERGETIAIFGDYDVDGVTSVTLLYRYLASKGARLRYYVPNRFGDGYGMSQSSIDEIASDEATLIITVDNGITAVREVEYATSLGIDTVVTDHHECQAELPDAVAIVNPHKPGDPYPFKELAGVGVIFKVVCACELTLAKRAGEEDTLDVIQRISREYLDLVAVGSVADLMPLTDENRLLVTYGLERLKNTERIGLRALMDAASGDRPKKINSGYIGYQLAPRINAAGRIETASRAVELFLSEDAETAKLLANALCEMNAQRLAEENRIVESAYRKADALPPEEREFVIVLEDDTWHRGILGIAASGLTERYGIPSILISFDGASRGFPAGDDLGVGSCRSVKGVNLAQALDACASLLVKHGGHELAAGLTIRRCDVPAFRHALNEYIRSHLDEKGVAGAVEYDCEATSSELTLRLAQELSAMEPFGQGNPEPILKLSDVTLLDVTPIGEGKHSRFRFQKDGIQWTGVKFKCSPSRLPVSPGDLVDLLFHLNINEFRGTSSLQLQVEELRPAESLAKEMRKQEERYREILSGASFSPKEEVLPSREEFALVYKILRTQERESTSLFSLPRLFDLCGGSVGYIKLKVILSVFDELNLCHLTEPVPNTYLLEFPKVTEKTDLSRSALLARLTTQQKN